MASPVTKASKKFGMMLRELRVQRNVNLRDLSAHLSVSIPYLSDVEVGRRDPLSDARIHEVADFLDADPLPLLVAASRERGRVTIDVSDQDENSVRVVMMLAMWLPSATKKQVKELEDLLKAAS